MIGQAVLEFAALRVHRHLAGEQLQPAGMVVVQVTHRDGVDVVDVDADVGQRLLDRLAGTWQHRAVLDRREEPPVQRRVPDQRGVEPGVQQHPAAVGLQQDAGHRLAHPLFGRRAVHRDRLRQLLPAERQQDDPMNSCCPSSPQPTDSAAAQRVRVRHDVRLLDPLQPRLGDHEVVDVGDVEPAARLDRLPHRPSRSPRRTVRQTLRQRRGDRAATSSPR